MERLGNTKLNWPHNLDMEELSPSGGRNGGLISPQVLSSPRKKEYENDYGFSNFSSICTTGSERKKEPELPPIPQVPEVNEAWLDKQLRKMGDTAQILKTILNESSDEVRRSWRPVKDLDDNQAAHAQLAEHSATYRQIIAACEADIGKSKPDWFARHRLLGEAECMLTRKLADFAGNPGQQVSRQQRRFLEQAAVGDRGVEENPADQVLDLLRQHLDEGRELTELTRLFHEKKGISYSDGTVALCELHEQRPQGFGALVNTIDRRVAAGDFENGVMYNGPQDRLVSTASGQPCLLSLQGLPVNPGPEELKTLAAAISPHALFVDASQDAHPQIMDQAISHLRNGHPVLFCSSTHAWVMKMNPKTNELSFMDNGTLTSQEERMPHASLIERLARGTGADSRFYQARYTWPNGLTYEGSTKGSTWFSLNQAGEFTPHCQAVALQILWDLRHGKDVPAHFRNEHRISSHPKLLKGVSEVAALIGVRPDSASIQNGSGRQGWENYVEVARKASKSDQQFEAIAAQGKFKRSTLIESFRTTARSKGINQAAEQTKEKVLAKRAQQTPLKQLEQEFAIPAPQRPKLNAQVLAALPGAHDKADGRDDMSIADDFSMHESMFTAAENRGKIATVCSDERGNSISLYGITINGDKIDMPGKEGALSAIANWLGRHRSFNRGVFFDWAKAMNELGDDTLASQIQLFNTRIINERNRPDLLNASWEAVTAKEQLTDSRNSTTIVTAGDWSFSRNGVSHGGKRVEIDCKADYLSNIANWLDRQSIEGRELFFRWVEALLERGEANHEGILSRQLDSCRHRILNYSDDSTAIKAMRESMKNREPLLEMEVASATQARWGDWSVSRHGLLQGAQRIDTHCSEVVLGSIANWLLNQSEAEKKAFFHWAEAMRSRGGNILESQLKLLKGRISSGSTEAACEAISKREEICRKSTSKMATTVSAGGWSFSTKGLFDGAKRIEIQCTASSLSLVATWLAPRSFDDQQAFFNWVNVMKGQGADTLSSQITRFASLIKRQKQNSASLNSAWDSIGEEKQIG